MSDLQEAVIEGAVQRVRPKIMTASAILIGLLPILWSHGAGADVMKWIAAPMMAKMVSSTILTPIVIPSVSIYLALPPFCCHHTCASASDLAIAEAEQ